MFKNVIGFVFLVGCADVEIETASAWCGEAIRLEGCDLQYCEGQMLLVTTPAEEVWLNCPDKDCSEEFETALWVCEEVQ